MALDYQENIETRRGKSTSMRRNERANRRMGESAKRLLVFIVATVALAKFFEAGRLISTDMTFKYLPLAIFFLFSFFFSLLILGYWVYVDEKEKNNLKHKFGLYEWVYRKRTGEWAKGRVGEEK